MVSVCLPSDAFLQHVPSYLGFSYLGCGVSLHNCFSKAAAVPYLGRGVAPHRPPSWPWTWSSSSRPSCAHAAAAPWTWGCSLRQPPSAAMADLRCGVARLGCCPWPRACGSSSQLPLLTSDSVGSSSPPLLCRRSLALSRSPPQPWARGSSSRWRFCAVRRSRRGSLFSLFFHT